MSTKYTLTCDCGKAYPIETSQAGQSMVCDCGKTLAIPSMLRIKKLPEWSATPKTEPSPDREETRTGSEPVENPEPNVYAEQGKPRVLAGNRLGVLIVALVMVVLSALYLFQVTRHKPIPLYVFNKQTVFTNGDSIVRRNSSPVTQEDYDFFLHTDPQSNRTFIVNDYFIDNLMTPIDAYMYFDVLKTLNLSENFYDNFEEIKLSYQIRWWTSVIALVVSCMLCCVPWLMPRRRKVVGTVRGSQWRK